MVGAPRRAPDFMVIYLAGTQPMWKHTPWIARMPGFGKPHHQLGPTQVQCFLLIGFAGFSPFRVDTQEIGTDICRGSLTSGRPRPH